MRTKLIYLSVFFIGLFLSADLFAQTERKKVRQKHDKQSCHFMEDLTEAQKTKIEEIKTAKRAKMIEMRADVNVKRAELEKLRISDDASENQINAKVDEISELRAEMQKERLAAERAIMNELTPEQRVKYRSHNKGKVRSNKSGRNIHHSRSGYMKQKKMHKSCPHAK